MNDIDYWRAVHDWKPTLKAESVEPDLEELRKLTAEQHGEYRKQMVTLLLPAVRVSKHTRDQLTRFQAAGIPLSEIVRAALLDWLEHRERPPVPAEEAPSRARGLAEGVENPRMGVLVAALGPHASRPLS